MPGNENAFETGSAQPDLVDRRPRRVLSIAPREKCHGDPGHIKRNGLASADADLDRSRWHPYSREHEEGRLKDRNMRERADVAILCVNPRIRTNWMAINAKVVETIEETDPVKGRQATDNVNEMAQRYIKDDPLSAARPQRRGARGFSRCAPPTS